MVGPSKQANIHTHMHNEVILVWGSFRLTPIRSIIERKLFSTKIPYSNLPMYLESVFLECDCVQFLIMTMHLLDL